MRQIAHTQIQQLSLEKFEKQRQFLNIINRQTSIKKSFFDFALNPISVGVKMLIKIDSLIIYTRLIYNDVTAIKIILCILVVLILTYCFCYLEVGVEIVLFLVRLSFFVFFCIATQF